ncbi:MAG: DUF559 domain-containing protein [Gordonia sp. (in: high G+C Gram-positive bacteria)]
MTALRMHGVWVPPHVRVAALDVPGDRRVHVRARQSAHRRARAKRFCGQYGRPGPEVTAVDDIPTALRHALRCLDDEGIVVVCDSILNQGLLEMSDLVALFSSAPRRVRRLLERCDACADSGTETMVRVRLTGLGITVRSQVTIAGVGRVDFLVGERLIIEIDSVEFHDKSPEQREMDRRRDEEAARLGYLTLRFGYRRVVYQWDEAQASVLAIIRRREHLRKLPTAG